MADSEDHSPGDDYFNDLSQQIPRQSNDQDGERRASQENNEQIPKPKRIACVLCRRRKLKCDGNKPSCGTCNRLQHDCSYDEIRRKSGPKRGYVKQLEARLAQVETLLKTQDDQPNGDKGKNANRQTAPEANMVAPDFSNIAVGQDNVDMLSHMERTINQFDAPSQAQFPHTMLGATGTGGMDMPVEEQFPWEMIGLGLDEPLPTQDVIDELNQAYFDKIHPSLPMIHRARYYAAMNLAPHMRPPVCLRYAMWCNAASVLDKYEGLSEHFYQRARKYIQQDEMKGHGESMITVAHTQTWALLATHEFKLMYFPRAWMSSGRAGRLALMMGLHRIDGSGLDVKQCLPPSRDWTDREERRRTFWSCFCTDRYSSIGTGWPMMIDEKDVTTDLPTDEEAFLLSKPVKTMTLNEALNPDGAPKLSGFAGVVLMACLFGRNLLHLHRPAPDDKDDDLNGEFWKRHRAMDNILLNTALALPDALRLPTGLNDPNIVFMNMNIHTSTICLHQAAIFKAERNRMSARISAESKVRCISAAAEIASVMRQISHLDVSSMNPFISFCLYVAARVFVQYLKSRPNDTQVKSSLQFLLSAMHAIKRKNPLTESFLVQLDVDLEGAGLDDSRTLRNRVQKNPAVAVRAEGCVFTIGMNSTSEIGTKPTSQNSVPTYGDTGLSMYNNPNKSGKVAPCAGNLAQALGYVPADTATNLSSIPVELPNRQRSPGTFSATYPSPQEANDGGEMDTSPDNSGDQRTPSSTSVSQQNGSSHTSHTGFSPQNQQVSDQQQDPGHLTGLFASDPSAFTTADFDMGNFSTSAPSNQQSEPGFVLPQNWTLGGTGLTPGATGMTPAGINDFMTDADWNLVMEGMTSWDTNTIHDTNMGEWLNGRRT